MSCQTIMLVTNERIQKEGGSLVLLSSFVPHGHSEIRQKISEMLSVNSNLKMVSHKKLAREMFSKNGEFSEDYIQRLTFRNRSSIISEILRTNNPCDKQGKSLSLKLYDVGRIVYTAKEIKEIGNPIFEGKSLAYRQIEDKHFFSIPDLILLGNSPEEFGDMGETLAHITIRERMPMTFDDAMLLGNPPNTDKATLVHYLIKNQHLRLSFEQILNLGNVSDRYGRTLAFYMATVGFTFSDEEIETLNNPVDRAGWSIKDAMNGYSRTIEEIRLNRERLNLKEKNNNISH